MVRTLGRPKDPVMLVLCPLTNPVLKTFRIMRSRVIEKYKNTLFLNKRQQEMLIGLILGDAHLESLYTPTLARLKVEHSCKQRDYVDWLYAEFKNWVRTRPRVKEVQAFGNTYQNYGFCTSGHKLLGDFQKRFYKDKKKIIPNDLEKDITSLGLAIWFMDDGSIKSERHKGVFLNTQGFKDNEVRKLQQILRNKFGIQSKTRNQTRNQNTRKQIYLGGKSGEKFITLIESHIIPSMEYKIPKILRLT